MTLCAFVETPDGLARALEGGAEPHRIFTDNPLLALFTHESRRPRNADALLSREAAQALGRAGLELADRVDGRLAALHAGEDPATRSAGDLAASEIRLAGVSTRLFSSTFYRAAVLARALDAADVGPADEIRLYPVDQPRFDPSQPLLPPRFAAPARALAEFGFFGAPAFTVDPVAYAPPAAVNETQSEDLLSRLMILTGDVVRSEVRERLFGEKSGRAGRGVFVAGMNEAIRETLPRLKAAGFSVRRMKPLMRGAPVAPVGFQEQAVANAALDDALRPMIRDAALKTGTLTPVQADAVAALCVLHIDRGLAALPPRRVQIEERLTRLDNGRGARPRLLVTNGLFGPYGRLAFEAVKRRGYLVADFEHGVTTGLAALSEHKLDYSEASVCDVLFCCSPAAARSFARARLEKKPRIEVIGLPDHVRRLQAPRLQRFWARRRLGLRGDAPVLYHVSTRPMFGNLRPGWYAPRESETVETDQTLIRDVYSEIPWRVLFKQYPTQRFPYEPGYETLIGSDAAVRFLKDEDVRYTRAAADAIVTMTPTSTLGWCVGAGAPMVWLDSRACNPLADPALHDRFKDAFPSVDLDEPNWPRALRDLLADGLEPLRAKCAEKSQARDALLRETVVGPDERPGARACSIIAETAANASAEETRR